MIKAEVAGAISAIEHEINKTAKEAEIDGKVTMKIVGTGIGNITENDVKLASGRNPAVIVGFDVDTDSPAKTLAERLNVEIRTFDIIYKISEWLKEEAIKKIPKQMVEELMAEVKILKVFSSMKDKYVIGARAEKGFISVGQEAKIFRKDVEIGLGKIKDLE
jgi:translation initiation factor IF-2